MRKTTLLAVVLTCAFAAGANADMLSAQTWVQTWGDNFNAYGSGFLTKPLGKSGNPSSPTWTNSTLAQYKGTDEGGGNISVEAQACSNAYLLRNAYNTIDGNPVEGHRYQRVSFTIKTMATVASDFTLNLVGSNNDPTKLIELSNGIPMWDVSNLSIRPHVRTSWDKDPVSDWSGTARTIDSTWHSMDMIYDLATGAAEWYMDGALIDTLPNDPALQAFYKNRGVSHWEFWQKYQDANQANGVRFDDLKTYSAAPEPAALILVALGGLLGLRRRR